MLIIKLIILIIKIIMFTIKMTWSVWQENMKQFSYEGSRTPLMKKPSVLSRILSSRRRLLHRNGTFVPPAPPTQTRRRVKTDFRRKTGRSGPFFHQSGRFQGVERAKFRCRRSRLFGFSRRWPESGRFGRFSGPRGPKWSVHFLHLTQKKRRASPAGCTQGTLFPYNCWVSRAKIRFGPVWGVPAPPGRNVF